MEPSIILWFSIQNSSKGSERYTIMNITRQAYGALAVLVAVTGGCDGPGRTVQPGDDRQPQPVTSAPSTDTQPDQKATGPDRPAPGPIEVREKEYESGMVSLREEGYVDADGNFVRHGLVTTWFEDGAKKSEIQYAHGKQHGARLSWYPTGQMWGRGQYVDGLEDGTWTAWWQNGFKQREWHMDRGTWHGPFTEWHDNGEKKWEFEYVNGLKQGTMRIWAPRGTLVHEAEYVDDVEQPK